MRFFIEGRSVVYWMQCAECDELVDEFDERWPDAGFESMICKACDPEGDARDD